MNRLNKIKPWEGNRNLFGNVLQIRSKNVPLLNRRFFEYLSLSHYFLAYKLVLFIANFFENTMKVYSGFKLNEWNIIIVD